MLRLSRKYDCLNTNHREIFNLLKMNKLYKISNCNQKALNQELLNYYKKMKD